MSVTSTLVATGAVAIGYWVIRSVLQPGIDLSEEGIKAVTQKPGIRKAPAARGAKPLGKTALPHGYGAAELRQGAYPWYVMLDVPRSAGTVEIQEALKRRITQARSVGNREALAELAHAAAVGIREPRRSEPARRQTN